VSEGADRSLEREANVFAAELLMPEDVVREAFVPGASPEALATRLDLSRLALAWRLYSFELIPNKPAT
jgi:Zn-dependent peptidase ImmA (M78 family)